jgi:hypothetical protein
MDYAKGKIYKIVSDLTDKIYIGATCSQLNKRYYEHKSFYKTGRKTCNSLELFKLGETRIELIEDFPCERKEQLNAREGYYIKLYKDICINRNIAGRTHKEYKQDNKEQLIKQHKKYYESHKEQKKQYYEVNKENIKEAQKRYKQKNEGVPKTEEEKQKIRDYANNYYQTKIKAKKQDKQEVEKTQESH